MQNDQRNLSTVSRHLPLTKSENRSHEADAKNTCAHVVHCYMLSWRIHAKFLEQKVRYEFVSFLGLMTSFYPYKFRSNCIIYVGSGNMWLDVHC